MLVIIDKTDFLVLSLIIYSFLVNSVFKLGSLSANDHHSYELSSFPKNDAFINQLPDYHDLRGR